MPWMAMFSSTTFKHHCHPSFVIRRAGSKLLKDSLEQHPETQQTRRSARLDDTDFESYKASTLTPHQLTACAIPDCHRCPFGIYKDF